MKYDQLMDFLNAVFEEIMNFLGFTSILEALKTENYAFFKSFDGIMSCVFLALPILLFVEFFIVFFREREQLKTYKVNFFIIVFNRVIGRILSLGTIVWCIGFFQEYAPFQTSYTWYWFIYGYVVWELGSFIYHYFGHKVRLLWCLHSPHHAAETMNLSVNHAHFFLEFPYADFIRTATCMLLGVDPKLFFSILLLDITYATFIHVGEHVLQKGRLGFLGKLILTPSHHRVHHGRNPLYMDTNFCNLLNIWDRVFGTYQDEEDHLPIQYGITREMDSGSFFDVYFGEFKALYKDVINAPGLKNKILYLFMPPGWSHTGEHQTAKLVRKKYLDLQKETFHIR
ncbi:MAG: sterol desaturase family protein [Flavobacteriaceae bacterium]|uniref:sterol desaturase family protein n=1 Tax=Flagellimonas sp. SN16 TaxID=3415142 RepID=UPI003C615F1B|nr:sterol desaturase family protein [Flavobacteriaceae bacterium]